MYTLTCTLDHAGLLDLRYVTTGINCKIQTERLERGKLLEQMPMVRVEKEDNNMHVQGMSLYI